LPKKLAGQGALRYTARGKSLLDRDRASQADRAVRAGKRAYGPGFPWTDWNREHMTKTTHKRIENLLAAIRSETAIGAFRFAH